METRATAEHNVERASRSIANECIDM